MTRTLIAALALSVALVVFASAQSPQPSARPAPQASPQTQPAKNAYASLLERAKRSDPTLDFKELRMAYTETKDYSPYSNDREALRAVVAALVSKEYDKALTQADKILSSNYVDINAHFGAFAAHKALQHADQSAFHRFMFDGLLKSVVNSGDGKTEETAFIVISTDEEYVLFDFLGLRPTGQALVNKDGHSYDKMTAVDPKTNQTVVYFFNIDKPFNWLGNSLKH
jgi:hypothetical protein